MPRTALIAGASGLVGGHLLRRLLDAEAWDRVVALGRRTLDEDHPKLEQVLVDFDHLDARPFPESDDAFCCLGTTIKKAGSEDAFRRVDYDYVLAFGRKAQQHCATQFLVVSALGANAGSRIFYNRLKGEMENAVARLPYEAVQIVRPALLLGERSVARPKEKVTEFLTKPLTPLFAGPLRKFRPIQGEAVAAAMVAAAQQRRPGVHVFESDELQRVGR